MQTYLDFEKPISDLEGKIHELKKLAAEDESIDTSDEIERLEGRVHFTPLAGDRSFGEDAAIQAGLGRFRGYRKAIRVMEMADRFGLPVISLVDTAGAYPGVGAEERGQAEAIARSTEMCLGIKVPMVSIVIGEGGSGGAIAIATGNKVFMLEHAIYSVISPEGAASILWRDSTRAREAASNMKITAEDLKALGVIDDIIQEPMGGAHREPEKDGLNAGEIPHSVRLSYLGQFPMRLKNIALALLMATALAGCNDTLETATVDLSKVKNKVEQPLPDRLVAEMQKRNMPRNSPIMIRIFKEEGVMEIWKAKADNRFDKISQYQICAWSGKLGPKVKEGDRQAPEGFYNLTPAHLNPNSKYYLAINTGFPNRYDAANGRTGSNLMIHGACSSSGCYSMTDEQILEIYAFARDAFKGGQTSVQLEAFPFRMTAENMARHRNNENMEFWKMLKVGYDQFEITKRPPDVNVCGKKKNYELAYAKALDKLDGKVWYEPTEAERKAVVANKRKGHDLAYAPTGTSLEAGKLVKPDEFEALMAKRLGKPQAPGTMLASAGPTGAAAKQGRVLATASTPAVGPVQAQTSQTQPMNRSTASVMAAMATPANMTPVPQQVASAGPASKPVTTGAIPVPAPNPLAYAQVTPPAEEQTKKPFWKFW
ncbi:hypothetical protein Lal_00000043 [Lupinus albus]|nr:hypothetical protein Lal_00000043 [Lupinus albus]